jgi:purine-binding chemotaxis protein CheW
VDAPRGHLVFACGESLYALPSEAASEVVGIPVLTRVPGAPAHVLGVFAHRGEVVPVVDLALLVGSPAVEVKRAVLMRIPEGVVALTASRVAGVSTTPVDAGPLGSSGVKAHLLGPVRLAAGEAAVIEPKGLFDFLARGG